MIRSSMKIMGQSPSISHPLCHCRRQLHSISQPYATFMLCRRTQHLRLSKGPQAQGTGQQPTQQQGQQDSKPAVDQSPVQLPWWKKESAPNMIDVHSVQELVDEMAKAGDKLVILDFYAPFCNACRALYPKFVRLMQSHLEDTVFIKINWEENKDLARALGIKVLPYFQFYRGAEGKVDQFSCTVSRISRFKDALELFSGEFCSLEEFPGLPEFPDIKPGLSGEDELPTGDARDAYSPTSVRDMWWSD
ncbi:thioredoxin-like protein [Dunaliella salina]|uniref:Thioredoxin-like protein n=1 Tax=Dunaliella salina TaxID=3046 RepID=A0ABQ7H450_DUNSA|nr:thioredoxin-like protein [Dunaliella salina]|eukprot:KAF5841620.1 thioredoxin-like protein [Dunaliella salina]